MGAYRPPLYRVLSNVVTFPSGGIRTHGPRRVPSRQNLPARIETVGLTAEMEGFRLGLTKSGEPQRIALRKRAAAPRPAPLARADPDAGSAGPFNYNHRHLYG